MHETDREERAGLAGEYVLGTLDPAEAARAEALLRTDAQFAADVEAWRRRLDPLEAAIDPVAPPSDALASILAAIGDGSPDANPGILRFRTKAERWKWTAGVALAVAASLLAAVVFRAYETAPAPRFVAVLEAADRVPAFVATADPAHGGLLIRRLGAGPPPHRSFELWAIRENAPAQSLGLVDREAVVSAAALKERTGGAPLQNIVLAVTEEPEGGAKDGKPSGAPLFTGRLVQVPPL